MIFTLTHCFYTCAGCGGRFDAVPESPWPRAPGEWLCQSCWEAESAAGWWEMLLQLPPQETDA